MRIVSALPIILLFFAMFVVSGCEKGPEKKPIVLDPKYSVNVVPVPNFWPREKFDYPKDLQLKQTMMKAYRQYGAPDYLRRTYTADRRIVRPIDLAEDVTIAGRVPEETEWVFLEEKLLLEFDRDRIIEHELDDKIKIICLYGDPNEIKNHKTIDGDMNLIYTYYGHGTFTFSGDKLVKEDRFIFTHNQADTGQLR